MGLITTVGGHEIETESQQSLRDRKRQRDKDHRERIVGRLTDELGEALAGAEDPESLGLVRDPNAKADLETPDGVLEARDRPHFADVLRQNMAEGAARQAELDDSARQRGDESLPFFRPNASGVDIVIPGREDDDDPGAGYGGLDW